MHVHSQVSHHGQRSVLVGFHLSQFQQLAGRFQAIEHRGDATDGLFQQRALTAQLLGVFGVVPDIRAFQLAGYFFEAFFLDVVVKDTP